MKNSISTKPAVRPKPQAQSKAVAEYARLMNRVIKAQKELHQFQTALDKNLAWVQSSILPKMVSRNNDRVDIVEILFDHLGNYADDPESQNLLAQLISQIITEVVNQPLGHATIYHEKLERLQTAFSQFNQSKIDSMSKKDQRSAYDQLKNEHSDMLYDLQMELDEHGIEVNVLDIPFDMDPATTKKAIQERLELANDQREKFIKSKGAISNHTEQPANDFMKNFRTELYRRIVKLIHPDLERDETVKAMKNEWMKAVTVAYEEENMSLLIKLEQSIHKSLGTKPELPSEEKLKTHNDTLKLIIKQTTQQTKMLAENIKYFPLRYCYGPFGGIEIMNYASHALQESVRKDAAAQKKMLKALSTSAEKRAAFIDQLIDEMRPDFGWLDGFERL